LVKVFIDWINYSDDERKANKEALKKEREMEELIGHKNLTNI
jgi:hypothetical protein